MAKIRTVTFLMIIISTCVLTLSLTDAYPAAETTSESITAADTTANSNGSIKYAITHVVKTIEFQVGVLQDDYTDSDNATDVTTQEYIETDIKLLNVNLLRELLARATAEDGEPATKTPMMEEEKKDSALPTNLHNRQK